MRLLLLLFVAEIVDFGRWTKLKYTLASHVIHVYRNNNSHIFVRSDPCKLMVSNTYNSCDLSRNRHWSIVLDAHRSRRTAARDTKSAAVLCGRHCLGSFSFLQQLSFFAIFVQCQQHNFLLQTLHHIFLGLSNTQRHHDIMTLCHHVDAIGLISKHLAVHLGNVITLLCQ
jgi:hypothetical protein